MTLSAVTYASPTDVDRYGSYAVPQRPGDTRPVYRFRGRVGHDAELPAEPGRYHLWSGWFCPWAHRATIVREAAGIQDAVSLSYVDGTRDARGWGFREPTGPDPVEGFALLRDAYELTEPGFDGHVSVPTLWDRQTRRVATNDYATLDIDLATRFGGTAVPEAALYPAHLREEIDRLDAWLGPVVNRGAHQAATDAKARAALDVAFRELDTRLADVRFLLGDRFTLADVRLFVTLVRFDVTANGDRSVHPGVDTAPNLWRYARELLALEPFAVTTRFETFTRPRARVPAWG
jgi:putative glutathione S-transferase